MAGSKAALIGLALSLLAGLDAQAAERRPVETGDACPSLGAGFVRVPGGATCIRLSGRVAAGAALRRRDERAAVPRGAARLSLDTRTESDYGPVRTFVRVGGRR